MVELTFNTWEEFDNAIPGIVDVMTQLSKGETNE